MSVTMCVYTQKLCYIAPYRGWKYKPTAVRFERQTVSPCEMMDGLSRDTWGTAGQMGDDGQVMCLCIDLQSWSDWSGKSCVCAQLAHEEGRPGRDELS